jgi:UDP-N-acetylglucosamine acyltransferase
MATLIHPTAIVASGAQLGDGVEIGPYCVIGEHVKLGAGTKLHPHVVVAGHTTLGAQCEVFPFASLGQKTQDLKFRGGTPGVVIGDRTTLREYVTVNAATNDGDRTRVGNGGLIMAYAHIAHDCIIGNEVILANAATLAGHVILEDQVILGGMCGVHQFVRIGRLTITGGCTKVTQDIPPFMMADGNPMSVHGLNSIGLQRRGAGEQTVAALKKAYKMLYRENLTAKAALAKIEAEVEQLPEIAHLVAFVRASERGIAR